MLQSLRVDTRITKVKESSMIPGDLNNTFQIIFGSGEVDQRPYRDSAKLLQEHIEIIAESRKMIKEGKTITWKEFLTKNEGRKKRRI